MSVDLVSIDAEHQVLIDLLNRFGELLERGGSVAAAAELFDDIIEHTTAHFDHEERVMRNIGFPELERHRQQHRTLVDNATALRRDLEGATDLARLTPVTVFLNHMVLKHMQESDTYIRTHIHAEDRRQ